MESLRFDEFSHEKVILTGAWHLTIVLPLNIALEIEEVFWALSVPPTNIDSLLITRLLLLIRAIELNIIVHCHEQKVEEELFDA